MRNRQSDQKQKQVHISNYDMLKLKKKEIQKSIANQSSLSDIYLSGDQVKHSRNRYAHQSNLSQESIDMGERKVKKPTPKQTLRKAKNREKDELSVAELSKPEEGSHQSRFLRKQMSINKSYDLKRTESP